MAPGRRAGSCHHPGCHCQECCPHTTPASRPCSPRSCTLCRAHTVPEGPQREAVPKAAGGQPLQHRSAQAWDTTELSLGTGHRRGDTWGQDTTELSLGMGHHRAQPGDRTLQSSAWGQDTAEGTPGDRTLQSSAWGPDAPPGHDTHWHKHTAKLSQPQVHTHAEGVE